MLLSHCDQATSGFVLDLREPIELAVENVPGAVNIRAICLTILTSGKGVIAAFRRYQAEGSIRVQ
jgi:rhodanese-related sulfurtransferase